MNIRVYIRWEQKKDKKQYITCICKRDRKMCNKQCLKAIVSYDQYKDWKECFKNAPLKKSER